MCGDEGLKEKMFGNRMGLHTMLCPRTVLNAAWSISEGPLQVCLLSKFRIMSALLNYASCFMQQTKIVCLQVSVGPENNMHRWEVMKTYCFRNTFLHWRGQDLPQQNFPPPPTPHPPNEATCHMYEQSKAQFVTGHSLSLSYICPCASLICKLVLLGLSTPN